MTTVFLDTVGLLALWDQRDQWHRVAANAFDELRVSSARLVTTTFVLLECGNAAARRPYRQVVDRLRIELEASGSLITPAADEWRRAWAAYAAGDMSGPGIVDHVSFEVMRRMNVPSAFTNDRHFAAAGFEALF